MINNAWEYEVEERAGIKKGDRVRVKAVTLMKYSVAGLSSASLAKHALPGVVTQIIVSKAHGWNSARVVREGLFYSWQACEDLELAKDDDHADR